MKAHVILKVRGDFACFSRPEFKVERVSYPVMTPSAARGLLEAIFWKPEFRWEIREIWVLNPIKEVTIMRNELAERQGGHPVFIENQRQQRVSLVLQNVAYVIGADLKLMPHATDHLAKYLSQFERRLGRGQCYHTPYLGTREFPAWFEEVAGDETPDEIDREIGVMLFDLAYIEDHGRQELSFHRHGSQDTRPRKAKGYSEPLFFSARLEAGVLKVPGEKYQELYNLERRHA
ncbi:MAG: type I-C CRISPR-associated protein Cas5 [Deltaproteobacteria bacterium]|nr:type I-C CRISPR-associated protein Cas5 [Deltaproteobacteria bacterium]